MRPRTNGPARRGPLNQLPNPRKSKDQMTLESAAAHHEHIRSTPQRERLIEAGIITPRKRR